MNNQFMPDAAQPDRNPPDPKEGEGSLVVLVSTLTGGYPLSNATVTVYNEEGPQKFQRTTLQTGRDGSTTTLKLPAPVLTPQEQYECKIRPYAIYTVSVEFPRFYTNIHKDVQVFANIDSIVNSNMMPLPADIGRGSTTKIYIVPPTTCFGPSQGTRGAAEEAAAQSPTGPTGPGPTGPEGGGR